LFWLGVWQELLLRLIENLVLFEAWTSPVICDNSQSRRISPTAKVTFVSSTSDAGELLQSVTSSLSNFFDFLRII
jgi:hypothetical protein